MHSSVSEIPIIIQPNKDHTMIMPSNQLGRSITCDIKNRIPNLPVTWFKDGHVVYAAPNDNQDQIGLRIDQSLLSRLPVIPGLSASVGDLQGLYWCETWSLKPFRRVTSPTIMLRFTGRYYEHMIRVIIV